MMWVIGLVMMAVMVGMHTAGDGWHKRNSSKEVPHAVQMDHSHGQTGAGQRQMMHRDRSDAQEQDRTVPEAGDNDRRNRLPESAPPGGEKDDG